MESMALKLGECVNLVGVFQSSKNPHNICKGRRKEKNQMMVKGNIEELEEEIIENLGLLWKLKDISRLSQHEKSMIDYLYVDSE